MVDMREQTNAMFAEMHERMGKGETNSVRLDVTVMTEGFSGCHDTLYVKVNQNHSHMQQQIIYMVDDRDEDAKIRKQKVNDAMQQLDIKIEVKTSCCGRSSPNKRGASERD